MNTRNGLTGRDEEHGGLDACRNAKWFAKWRWGKSSLMGGLKRSKSCEICW